MKYITIVLLLIASVYPVSYAKYNFMKKNYLGAFGMIFLTLAAVAFPVYLLFTR